MTAETAEMAQEDLKDLEVILAEPGHLEINGIPCEVKRLKAREFFGLMNVLSVGVGGNLAGMNFDTENQKEFAAQLIGILPIAIANAVDPFIIFVRKLVFADDPTRQNELFQYLEDPEVSDLIDILNVVLEQEADTIWELVGKAQAFVGNAKKVFNRPVRGRKSLT